MSQNAKKAKLSDSEITIDMKENVSAVHETSKSWDERISQTSNAHGEKQEFVSLVIYSLGIFCCYLVYGFIQEGITRGDYDGERFTFSQALVFVQCVINAIFAKAMIVFLTKPEQDKTPKPLYAACAFCYMGAMVASNHALLYIAYPKQVLGKACKPIPVMILGVLLAHKRYPIAKYFCVLMIVLGVAGFMYKDGKDSGDSAGLVSMGFGEILLLVSLTLDGLTGVTQERMRAHHFTNHHYMMHNVNLWSCFILGAALLITGEGTQFVQFVMKHPKVVTHLAMFSVMSALGQHFIFLTVVTFGPLTCSVITTTRKFFTILFSVFIFQNPMNTRQWLSTALVFAGLGLDSIYGKSLKPKLKISQKE
ncbi:solute carrier family 35 member B1 isoform X1 [Ciona intestinalis]